MRLAIALFAAVACPLACLAQDFPDPAGSGSHERFLEYLQGAEDRVFQTLLQRYDRYISTHELDVAAKVERCRFLGLASCGDESEECPYWEQYEECLAELQERHPRARAVLLYSLENLWGDAGVAAAEELLGTDAISWKPNELAEIHEKLALIYNLQGSEQDVIKHALRAMELDPSLDLSLVAARAMASSGYSEKAVEVLISKMQTSTDYWAQIQKINLLADLGAYRSAALALERLEYPDEAHLDYLLHARVWMEVGRVKDAREALIAASRSEWMRWRAAEVHRDRFRLELTYGDPKTAMSYYEAFRDTGFSADPFLRHRLRLAFRYPGAPWRPRDALGGLALIGLMLFMIALPGVVLVPIHYVGLRRARANPSQVPMNTRWGLRHAWCVLAVVLIAEVPFFYMDGVGTLDEWWSITTTDFTVTGVDDSSIPDRSLALGGLVGMVVAIIGTLSVFRRRDFGRLGRGAWTLRKTMATSILGLVALRLLLGFWIVMMPESIRETMGLPAGAGQSFIVTEMCLAMGRLYGVPVLFFFIVLAAPICEEIIFRGILLDAFRRHLKFTWANLVQAGLFASLHEAWVIFPFFLTVGLVAGILAKRSGGLLAPVILHAGNNAVVFWSLSQQLST